VPNFPIKRKIKPPFLDFLLEIGYNYFRYRKLWILTYKELNIMFCRTCGAQLPDTAKFCGVCGSPVVTLQSAPAPLTPPVPPAEPIHAAQLPTEILPQDMDFTPAEAVAEPIPMAEDIVPAEEIAEAPMEATVPMPAEEIQAAPAAEPVIPVAHFYTAPAAEVPVPPYAQPQASVYAPVPPYSQPPVYAPMLEPMVSPTPAAPQNPPQKAKKVRHRPHIAVRITMQVLSFLLCLVLMVSLLVNVLLLDLRHLTSSDGLESAVSAVLGTADGSEAAAQRSEESLNVVVDMVYDIASSQEDVTIPFSKEDLRDFVEESTVPEFLTEKLADYAMDIIHGTEKTEIHADELMDLLEENEKALREELGIALTPENKASIAQTLQTQIEENDLNSTIHQTVNDTLEENLDMDLDALREALQWLTGDTLLYISLGISLLLILILLALNYYNVGAGLSWSASAGLTAGTLLMLPVLLVQILTDALASSTPELAGIDAVVHSILPVISSLHIWLLVGSMILLLLSIALRVTFWILRRRRAAA
jgi:ribosomal protein L40E